MIGCHWLGFLFLPLLYLSGTAAFDESLLKKCAQSGFCHRNREYAKNISETGGSYYSIERGSVRYDDDRHTVTADILKRIPRSEGGDKIVVLPFTLDLLNGSQVRFTIDEKREVDDFSDMLTTYRYNETSTWCLVDPDHLGVKHSDSLRIKNPSFWNKDYISIYDVQTDLRVVLQLAHFSLKVYRHENLQVTINDRSFLNVEHLRSKDEQEQNLVPEEVKFDSFYDSFAYASTDSLPFGPESVALDITFHNYQNVYGIPEHPDHLKLRDTSGGEPYRMFNADVFEYTVNSVMPTYGSIPFMVSNRPGSSVGVFWMNSADTWIDIKYGELDTGTHWISETGIVDVILFFEDSPLKVTESFTNLSGRPALPPLSSIGYHQCRWNYNDATDVLTVNSEMDKAQMPYDFIWLDLEYTDNKKYFTWKPDAFPNPLSLLSKLAQFGRNMVVLIDPHLKVNYEISDHYEEAGSTIKNKHGDSFHGQCWPGESVWIDTFSSKAQKLWAGFFQTFIEGAKNLFIWNDMNEPSVFDGPETTAPKDLIHYGNFEHRSVHNLYGRTFHEATYKALIERYVHEDKRAFVLTRSFFAGSQRTAASWTGDNAANWDYLKISIPMILSSNIAGMPFIGADVGGFSGDPQTELLVRWYQTGIWYPFFRGHAHIETKRREPYLLPEPAKSIVRESLKLRYALLPTLYTAFHDANVSGIPIMNPMFYVKPNLEDVYSIDDQFYVGQHGILVKPITTKNVTKTTIYFPPGKYYNYHNFDAFTLSSGDYVSVKAELDEIPIFLEGGHIITRRDRFRRSSKLMANDPFTLVVAPDIDGYAQGTLYYDDGETFAYQRGEYLKVEFTFKDFKISGKVIHMSSKFANLSIERIVIPKLSSLNIKETINVEQNNKKWMSSVKNAENSYVIQNTQINLGYPWTIQL
ncbi:glucan 1,3-alpha-glucosidase ROT2 Ecym_3060 [Eremothecium cymbalariae DBVPG|uniref:Glucosidase II subunit alpha n=1 Tax=Eremothecium cymbalariae (strain CBS 270.75 / DBVPG 7215 / KCTC 17166 / NRRL Y-17582) TaxID=931890 RepID=G8JR03_ERECY|nr:Hypothetical protein Ecym_3060 [Eremothecium cymbalariae DBVPG\